ncbi:Sec-independent protein translocase protein TatB [Lysobacter firmicutimachus]|uniref:Sec-independent protein translocase protein TatB n=1 Tax=Lysobacter firmicutimachus TaxID=1792846 RepID=A0AAU8MZE2_9GAMM
MFDIGFSEVFVIAIVALIVLGPERLPKAARFAGLWVRRARAQWYSVKSELENELADEELKRSLRQAQSDLRDAQAQLRDSGQAMRNEVDELNRRIAAPAGAGATQASAAEVPPDDAAPASAPPEPARDDAANLAAGDTPLPTHDASSSFDHGHAGAALPDYRPRSPSTTSDDERR